ncbi:hypothetical protein [Paenibacillus zanthoxyli]|nr:hypothetical protein [Paenibacillus zanthoxyli]
MAKQKAAKPSSLGKPPFLRKHSSVCCTIGVTFRLHTTLPPS